MVCCRWRLLGLCRCKKMPSDPIARCLFKLPPGIRVSIVLIGAVMVHLTIGTYHTFGNMLPYMASYMRNYTDPTVRIEHFMWIPTFQGCFPFAMVIGGWVSYLFGPRMATSFGCTIVTLGVGLSAYTIKHSFIAFFLTYGLMFGFGMGIAYVSTVAMAINWAPDKVGLVSGIVAAGFGISSSIFAPIQTRLVNPDNLAATKEGYFLQRELLERVPGVFLTLGIVYFLMQTFALIVVCDPPEKLSSNASINSTNDTSARRRSQSREKDSSEESSSSDDEVFMDSTSLMSIIEHPDSRSMTPQEMFRSYTFYALFAALFCCSFYANMFYNLYKTFAEQFIDDDFFLAIAFSLGSIANAISRIAWGYMTDKTSFKTTVSIATCFATILLLTMPVTRHLGKYAYLLWLIGTFICMGATHALFITATVRCYGPRHKATNYGFLIFSTTLSGSMLAIISQFYLKEIGYTYLLIGTAGFPFIAFLITVFIHKTPQGHLIS